MQRAHKIRLNPTPEQEMYFRKACGTARFVYNWGLAEVKRALDDGRTPASTLDLKAHFNTIKREQFPWVYEVTKCVVEGAFRNLGAALANFRASKRGARKGKRVGFPKYKRKKRGGGSFYLANDKFAVDGHWISIPKLGQVNMSEPMRLAGKIMGVTISQRAGWWWVSIVVEVACMRSDAQHKATSRIARKAVLIGLEDLNVAGMLKNRRLSQALSDASLSELHRQMRYKAEWYGGQVVTIARYFPSSRLHNGCGGYKADLDLAERVWICPACGKQVDRDLNAARNIRDEALRLSAVLGVASSARKIACGRGVRPSSEGCRG